jgi:hypothetical protein
MRRKIIRKLSTHAGKLIKQRMAKELMQSKD